MKFKYLYESSLKNIKFHDIDIILDWLKVYQRTKVSINKVKKYSGNYEDKLIQNKEYKLYRGLFLSNDESSSEYYNLDDILKTNKFIDKKSSSISWTTNLKIARRFALGNTNVFDNKTEFNSIDKLFKKYGIVIEHIFSPSEVILDLEYISENNDYLKNYINWPDESEVIINPVKGKSYKVIEVIQ